MKTTLRCLTTTGALLALLSGSGCTPRNVIKPFTTDQCSGSPEGPKDNPNAWCDCCLQHDRDYWEGGTRADRRESDRELRNCVTNHGHPPRRSKFMYGVVRVMGSPFLPFPWRWGYGWRYFRNYGRLSDEEADSVKAVFSRGTSRINWEHGCDKK